VDSLVVYNGINCSMQKMFYSQKRKKSIIILTSSRFWTLRR
jgi:hypothetical protein